MQQAMYELFPPADFGLDPELAPAINLVGPANVFVSHAWGCNFVRLCEAVESTLLDDNERF